MLVNLDKFQRMPVGLIEKSFEETQNIIFPLAYGFMRYTMICGVSDYHGTIDYSEITLQ